MHNERVVFFDQLRGLAIVAVVAIHSTGAGLSFSLEGFNFNFTVFWRQLINFGVPLFLVISGYFIDSKAINTLQKYRLFLRGKFVRVYVPCVWWSLVSFGVSVVLFDLPIGKGLLGVFTCRTFGSYYFIALVLQYYILAPVLCKIASGYGLFLSALISFLSISLVLYLRYFHAVQLPLVLYAGVFPVWIVFFVYGLYLRRNGLISIGNNVLIWIVIFTYCLSCLESYFLYFKFGQIGNAVTAIKVSSFLYSFSVISLLFNNVALVNNKLLKILGEFSFGIYLIHLFFLPVLLKVFSKFSTVFFFQPLYQLCVVVTCLMICCGVMRCGKIVFDTKFLRYIGFI